MSVDARAVGVSSVDNFIEVIDRPLPQGGERFEERSPELGEPILDAHGRGVAAAPVTPTAPDEAWEMWWASRDMYGPGAFELPALPSGTALEFLNELVDPPRTSLLFAESGETGESSTVVSVIGIHFCTENYRHLVALMRVSTASAAAHQLPSCCEQCSSAGSD